MFKIKSIKNEKYLQEIKLDCCDENDVVLPLLFEKELFRCVWKSCMKTIVSTVATFVDLLS